MPGPFDDLIPSQPTQQPAQQPAPTTPGIIMGRPKQMTPQQIAEEERAKRGEIRAETDQAIQEATFNMKQQEFNNTGGPGTADEKKIATLTTRLAGGLSDITGVLKDAPDAAAPGFIEGLRGDLRPGGFTGMAARSLAGAPRRAVVDAQRDVLDALLTLGTGAAYAQEQLDAAVAAHFPQYGDTPDEVKIKQQRFERAVAAAKANAGPAWLRVEPMIQEYMKGLSVGDQQAANPAEDALKAKFPEATRFLYSKGELVGYEDASGDFVAVVDNQPPPDGPSGGPSVTDSLYAGVGDIAQGVGDTLGLVGNPLNAGINAIAGTNLSTDLGQTFRDATGAPQGNALASAINRGGVSALTMAGAAGAARPFVSGVAEGVTNALASQPVRQAVGGVTAGAAVEGSRQAGAPVPVQIGAGLVGGMLGYGAAGIPNALAQPRAVAPVAQSASRLIPNAQQVVQDGKAIGTRVMTSDIRPPTTRLGKLARTVGDSIPIAGTAGPRAAQQTERVDAVQKLMREFGADESAVEAVSKDLVKTRGATIGKLSAAKNQVIQSIQGAVPAPKAIAEIDKQITKLQGIDDTAFKPVIDRLTGFKTALQSGKSLEQVEGQRKLLGDLFSDPSLASIKGDGQKAINAIYDPLRQDMGAFIEAAGGPAAKAKWAGANERLSAMAGELDASAFKNLLNNAETTPESAAKIIFGKTPSDMKRLYGSLSEKGRAKVQAAIMFQAAEKSTTNDMISPQKFAAAMQAMSKATGVFFSPADKAKIDGVTRLIKATQHASDAAANPMTGAQNTPLIAGLSIGQIFGAAALPATAFAGLMARAYESAPVRDAFLRLGRTRPGSPQEARAIQSIVASLSASNDNAGQYVTNAPGLSQAAASDQVGEKRPIQP